MKSHLIAAFFITCLFCIFVTSLTEYVPPRPDQVDILFAFKNEFSSHNCDRMWNTLNRVMFNPNISSWSRKVFYHFDGVVFDSETGFLTELDLRGACISGTIQANSSLFKLQHLRHLDLSINHFESSPFPSGFGRLSNLEYLDLSENGFIGEVPSSISNLTRLTILNLSYNKLTGRFPPIHNLTKLSEINLSYNHFSGTIPSSLFTMPSLGDLRLRQNQLRDPLENMTSSTTSRLYYLDMAENLLSCRILEPISKLNNLTHLDLSFQNTTYTINFDFLPFKSLKYLDLSGNHISRLGIRSTNVSELILSSCNITELPAFIKTLRNLWNLDISNNSFKEKLPEWLWDLPSLTNLDLSANGFQGSFPIIPSTIHVLSASNNYFTGDIPLSLCNASYLLALDLASNNFSGSVPPCLSTTRLTVLKLSNNNLTGTLPDIIYGSLVLLYVGYNQISGKLPRSLVNSTRLMFLNVESNRITDTFPFWLEALAELQVMVLRSNKFHGPLSSSETPLSFPALRIIDISRNNFNGSMPPSYFANWSAPLALVNNTPQVSKLYYTGEFHHNGDTPRWYIPSIYIRKKGRNTEYGKIPEAYTAIDFSGNRLEGRIPDSIGLLKSLMSLDLSNNSFTGRIPSSFSNLTQLESLDLSKNQLSGEIPQELRALTFLAYTNMSHNRLTGQIPQGSQIGGQPKSCFEGNLNLCGLPLQENCFKENETPSMPPQTQKPEQEPVLNWKAAVIGYGPGVLFGVTIAQALATYKPLLFYKLFRL